MKNRKLFAILTLVAFMMTLLPMAAFALTGTTTPNQYSTIVTLDKTEVDTATAAGDDYAKFTIYVYNEENEPLSGGYVYVASSRGNTDKFVDKNDANVLVTQYDAVNYPEVWAVKADETGKAEVRVYSNIAGTSKIGIGTKPPVHADTNVYSFLIGKSEATLATVGLVTTKELTFRAGDADAISLYEAKADGATVTIPSGFASGDTLPASVKANGIADYELKFQVKAGNVPVANQEVKFSYDNGLILNKSTVETDANGIAKVIVTSLEEDTFTLTAKVGSKNYKVDLVFGASEVADIELASGGENEKYAKDMDYDFKIRLLDANGKQINYTEADTHPVGLYANQNLKIRLETVAKPTDARIEDDLYSDENNMNDVKVTADGGLLKVILDSSQLNKYGSYKIRVSLNNGKYVEVPFSVHDQGDVVKMSLSYPQNVISKGFESGKPTVKLYDANDVMKKITDNFNTENIEFASSNTVLVSPAATSGAFTVPTNVDEKYYDTTVVVTAIDKANDLSASVELRLAKLPTTLVADDANGVVGEKVSVPITVVDMDGNQTTLFKDGVADATMDVYVTSKPADASVKVNKSLSLGKELKEKGITNIEVSSTEAGVVKLNVIVKHDNKTYATPVTVTFGAPKAKVGAENVTMFIGSNGYVADGVAATMDQAPFIQDNRTFVPVRMVATALGATNQDTMWDPATQTITLVRPDLTVTMTIGSNVLTLSDGTTVVADVAPFIVAETGRTVLPFRAIAEAFGAQVEAVFAADGTVTAVTFQQ